MNLTHEQKVMMLVRKWERKFNGLDGGMKDKDYKKFHMECGELGIPSREVTREMEDYYLV